MTRDTTDVSDCSGVLTFYGPYRPNTLGAVLGYLTACPDDVPSLSELRPNFQPANIDLAWSRAIGPFCCIMMRYSATRSTHSILKDRDNLEQLNRAINVGRKKEEEKAFAFIHDTEERWDRDPLKTYCAFIREGENPATAEAARLGYLLSILASDPDVDIASYDRVVHAPGTFTEGWRLYDLAGRGPWWLAECFEMANRLSGPSDNNIIVPRVMPLMPEHFPIFANTTLKVGSWVVKDSAEGYLYCRVHSRDDRGLFAAIDRCVRSAGVADSRHDSREVVRSCCRGIGGHSLVMVVVQGSAADRQVVEERLTEMLDDRRSQRTLARKGERVRSGGDEGEDRIRVRVVHSKWPPAVAEVGKSQAIFMAQFAVVGDRPKVLRKIYEDAEKCRGARARMYYIDARAREHRTGNMNAAQDCFKCAIAWTVEKSYLDEFWHHMKKSILPLCDRDAMEPWFSPD